jgi:hypothetical protein
LPSSASVDLVDIRRRQQLTPSPSSSNSDRLDIKSCFDTGDEQEETDAETQLTDADVNEDDKADLPALEWLAREDNANTVPIDVDGDDRADLAWIVRKENAYLLEYYLD